MSCILRAYGQDFDVKCFLQESLLIADSFWVKGERQFPNSTRIQTTTNSSGIRVVVSEADFTEFLYQIEDAVSFFRQNHDELRKLTAFPSVEGVVLDFGVDISRLFLASFVFPPELLSCAGAVGVSLCLSVYPSDSDT